MYKCVCDISVQIFFDNSSASFLTNKEKSKMATKKGLSLNQEEILCEKVRSYPILYDKSHKGYKEKDAVENAWNELALELEFLENGKS